MINIFPYLGNTVILILIAIPLIAILSGVVSIWNGDIWSSNGLGSITGGITILIAYAILLAYGPGVMPEGVGK